MNYQEKYQKSKSLGYSDEEINKYLSENDPKFNELFSKSEELGYRPEEIFQYLGGNKKESEPEFSDYTKDFATQTTQGLGIGALGTYGDIFSLLGLHAKNINPAEKEKYSREFNILEKMQRGEVPSYGEFLDLSSDEPVPRFSRLPTTQDVEELGKELNVVTEPKTPAGRYGKRIGKLGGGGAALGGAGLLAPMAAGVAGQTLEEFGAPPWAQAAAEIIMSLKFAPKSVSNVTSKSPEVEKVVQNLRKAGFSEQDITLAKNALEERNILKKYASLTPEAENTINQGVKNSENLLKEQIKKGLPGYAEGGLPYLEKQANNVYGAMEELASNVPIKNKEPFRKSIQKSIDYMEKSALLPEEKQFIEFLKEGLAKVDKSETADFMTSFYRKLGRSGKWTDPKTKEHLLSTIQKGIKQSFAESGPEAAKFGNYFEKTNEAWKHWIKTKDLIETIEKAHTVDGMNLKKLTSILNEPENHKLAKKVLGPQTLENIKNIAEGGQHIESLLKQIPKTDKSFQSLKVLEGIRSLFTGDYRPLAALIGLEGAKRLSTQILIDPEKQNIMKKIITAAKNNASQQAVILSQELIKTHSVPAKASEKQPQ